jgi:hypothetical protein
MPRPIEKLEDVIARHRAAIAMSLEYALAARRPKGVDKAKFGMATTKAAREPMLNAHPQSITRGLLYKEPSNKHRQAKGEVYKRLIIKPLTADNAKLGRKNGWWGERTWIVYTLKYAHGFVLVTDLGQETSKFNSYGELRSAINKSGWQILRNA